MPEEAQYAPHEGAVRVTLDGGSYRYDARLKALDEATALGMGLVLEVHSAHTEAWASPKVEVGQIKVYAPSRYKAMPTYVITLEGADEHWVPEWQKVQDAAIARMTSKPFVIDDAHLFRQYEFSQKTFGPGDRLHGVLDHIRKELAEVEAEPQDVSEWADLIILSFDGALRQGFDRQEILDAVLAKQAKNEGRRWPDWRTADLSKAIEHVRDDEPVQVRSTGPADYVPLAQTTLSLRLVRGLTRHGLETVGQLRAMLVTDRQLQTIRGIGPESREAIQRMLAGEESLYD